MGFGFWGLGFWVGPSDIFSLTRLEVFQVRPSVSPLIFVRVFFGSRHGVRDDHGSAHALSGLARLARLAGRRRRRSARKHAVRRVVRRAVRGCRRVATVPPEG